MKHLLVLCLGIFLLSCNNEESKAPNNSSNKLEYIVNDSVFPNKGKISIIEQKDGRLSIRLELKDTQAGATHPAHLHSDGLDNPDASIAAMLSPVNGDTGLSETIISTINDGKDEITFERIKAFAGSIKVHLDAGANKKTVIFGANIGSLSDIKPDLPANGRGSGITICNSN